MSVVKAALVRSTARRPSRVSWFYYLADEVAGTHRGMMIAIPEDEWAVFHGLSPQEIAPILKDLARAVRLSHFRKQPRGPKKPRPKRQSGAKIPFSRPTAFPGSPQETPIKSNRIWNLHADAQVALPDRAYPSPVPGLV